MKTNVSITGVEFKDVADRVRDIEQRGFTSIGTQENRHDPFMPLAIAATASEHLDLRTNVAISFVRSPMASAK